MDMSSIPTRNSNSIARFSESEKVDANSERKKYFPRKIYSPEAPAKSVMNMPRKPASLRGIRLRDMKLSIASRNSRMKL